MKNLEEYLLPLTDEKNREFFSRLVPNVKKEDIIGCKNPIMKKLAKDLYKSDAEGCREFMSNLPHRYYEENFIHGQLIALCKNIDTILEDLDEFLPYVDNWGVCDSTSASLKIFAKHKAKVYEKLKLWLKSDKTYEVRFALVALIDYFLDEAFDKSIFDLLITIQSEEYYVNIALAWYYSFALIKQYDAVLQLFLDKKLSPWVHNKAIQKAIESYRISDETKDYLRSLKLKTRGCSAKA